MKLKLKHPFWVICLIILATSCSLFDKEDENPETTKLNSIEIGETVEVASSTVSISGGSIKVAKPDTPIDGMEISIPANSFTTPKSFKVSYSEIKSHQFGPNFNPISPMITVSYDGGYSADEIQVTIPIKLPEGHFAMAFYLDKTTGKLEGLPVLKLSSNSITVTTRHFMSGTDLNPENLKSASVTPNASANMIISSISESVLQNSPIINSGFTPGRDDWEFINYGSYLAPGGHCAGQSMTSMWYYYEKKLNGETDLFHQFDQLNLKTNPNFMWQDNPLGYRFASVIQEDFNFEGWLNSLNLQSYLPGIVFKSFAASILVTGEPQFVLIRNSGGHGGHAMIVYKVNFKEGKLYIADPNYPNNRESSNGNESIRTIDYVSGVLKPYETGLTAGASSITMDQIGYFGKTAYIEWPQIGKRWEELKKKTIGSVAPHTFPSYTIKVRENEINYDLVDGAYFSKDTLVTSTVIPDNSFAYQSSLGDLGGSMVFDEKGVRIDHQTGSSSSNLTLQSKLFVLLKPGVNKLGYYIVGWKSAFKNGNIINNQFIDFKWINVNYIPLNINPNPLLSEPNKANKLTAATKGKAPKSAKYVWDFGDGSSPVSVVNDSIVNYTYTKEGKFTIKVELYDNSTNKKLIEKKSVATISKALATVTLGSYTLKLLPEASTSGTTKVQHQNNKLIISKTSGTITRTAEISWLSPPSGNMEVSQGKVFMNQIFTFNFNVTSTSGTTSFPGCEIMVNELNLNTGWYNDWQQLNEETFGLNAAGVQKNLPATVGISNAAATINMSLAMWIGNSGSAVGVDGELNFSGSIKNFWAPGDNMPFSISYSYKD